jgi:hypothetical protein
MNYPVTVHQRLEKIAVETARMSYPGGMSRGRKKVLKKEAKKKIERFFSSVFPIDALCADVDQVTLQFDIWHAEQTQALGRFLVKKDCLGNPENNPLAVAAKLLNTFMHQLMKYEGFRPLLRQLHLPLDARIFQAFAKIDSAAINRINKLVEGKAAYEITHDDYMFIQNTLWEFIGELNERPLAEFKVTSRIELNYLWLG